MKDIEVQLPKELDTIKIILLGDLHRGSQQFNEPLFLKTLKFIENNKEYYCILLGDLIDNALKTSKSDCYKATESPQKSAEWLVEKLEPIKDRILACNMGNHEERTEREVGMDLTYWICKSLGIESRYSRGPFILYMNVGKKRSNKNKQHIFTLFGTHGASSGITMGSALNKLKTMTNIVSNADIYVMGHTHKPIVSFSKKIMVSTDTKKHYYHEAMLVNGSSFLDYEESYGEAKMYEPISLRIPIITLKTGYNWKKVCCEFLD